MVRTRIGVVALAGTMLAAAVWALSPTAVEAKGKNKVPKEHKAHGRIVAMTTAADGTGSITIETREHHKKKDAAAANAKPTEVTKTFKIGPGTKFVGVSEQGKAAVTLAAVRKWEHVVIEEKEGTADEVDIMAPKLHHHHQKRPAAVALN